MHGIFLERKCAGNRLPLAAAAELPGLGSKLRHSSYAGFNAQIAFSIELDGFGALITQGNNGRPPAGANRKCVFELMPAVFVKLKAGVRIKLLVLHRAEAGHCAGPPTGVIAQHVVVALTGWMKPL